MDTFRAKFPQISIDELLILDSKSLHGKLQISLQEAEDLQKEAALVVIGDRIVDGGQARDWVKVGSGCEGVDLVTKGGFPCGMISEIYGEAGVGKTQLCLQLTVAVQLPPIRSAAAFYVCTEKMFPANRLRALSAQFPPTLRHPGDATLMDRVFVEHCIAFDEMKRLLLLKLPKLMENVVIRLIVVDSIAAIFRSEEIKYLDRSKEIDAIATQLKLLAKVHNAAVICVNQVTDDPLLGSTGPCLGNAWANHVACRYEMTRNNSGGRSFRVVNAPDLPPSSSPFTITESGLL